MLLVEEPLAPPDHRGVRAQERDGVLLYLLTEEQATPVNTHTHTQVHTHTVKYTDIFKQREKEGD